MAKQGTDLHTSNLTQALAYEVARDGFLDYHIHEIRRVYKARRDVMLEALERYFPEGCSWTRPEGGLFLWVRVPDPIDTTTLLPTAVARRVAYVPGSAFYVEQARGARAMRLNFSNASPEHIEEGCRRLGGLLKEEIARSRTIVAVPA